jgi:hypothetical protein
MYPNPTQHNTHPSLLVQSLQYILAFYNHNLLVTNITRLTHEEIEKAYNFEHKLSLRNYDKKINIFAITKHSWFSLHKKGILRKEKRKKKGKYTKRGNSKINY